MLNQLKTTWKLLQKAKSGRRFQAIYWHRRRKCPGERCWSDTLRLSVGVALMLFGLAIGWLPGPGGFVGIIGLGIVAEQSLLVARLVDRVEAAAVQGWHWLQGFWQKKST